MTLEETIGDARACRGMADLLNQEVRATLKMAADNPANHLYFQLKAYQQAAIAKLYAERATAIAAGQERWMPSPDDIKTLDAKIEVHHAGVLDDGKPVGWMLQGITE